MQQFDIGDPFDPVLESTVSVPHPNMLRLSRDNQRLYVTNSLLTPWDNDPDFGPATQQRLRDLAVRGRTELRRPQRRQRRREPVGQLRATSEKQTTTGPAGPHMMLFDPSFVLAPGEH